ncbi:MAG: TatD family hydrolase [Alistipes sp.]|nr:TatD family hydrolase [Alistipes sp.]
MAKYIDIHTHNPAFGVLSPTMAGIHPWGAERGLPMPEFGTCDIVGETGLDYASKVDKEAQKELFCKHLEIAEKLRKPVVLHMVKSFEPTMQILERYNLKGVVFHGFIGSREQAAQAINRGYYLSFGHRSLSSPRTCNVIATMNVENLFCETDDNTSIGIDKIYDEVAALRGISREELALEIEKNYRRLFDIR